MSETGVVKFQCELVAADVQPFPEFESLCEVREALRERGWIGVDQNGIAFGNLSVRAPDWRHFIVTGSATSAVWPLELAHLATVTAYDFGENWVCAEGRVTASSESLTHAAVYEADASIRAIIHCHSRELWRELLNVAPTASATVEYGTPGMAREVQRLFRETDVLQQQIFVMAGHEDGIVAFGASLEEAFAALRR